jgi:DNA-directed RNA polymerase subunit H (RpoH/RPB5)
MNFRNTLMEMLIDYRGYKVVVDEPDSLVCVKPDNSTLLVVININDKLNTEILNTYFKIVKNLYKHIIIVNKGCVTSSVKTRIVQYKISEKSVVELFSFDELTINIMKHVCQPKFKKLSKSDTALFKDKFGTNIPVMLQTDSVARFMGFMQGDIIEITRKNGYVVYRIVKS